VSAFRGLPQGGGLSPILWSVVADSLLRWLSRQRAFAQGYADDGVILVCGKFLDIICDLMQRMLYGVEKWCSKFQVPMRGRVASATP